MHQTVRVVLVSIAFLGVSVLSAVEQAPFVQVGDDAEAFTGDRSTGATSVAGDPACTVGCVKAAGPECSAAKMGACVMSCNCSSSVDHPKACSVREPCSDPRHKDSKQSCVNGLCLFTCTADKDCGPAGGGVCRVGHCRARTPEEVGSCKANCDACMKVQMACKDKVERCLEGCGTTPD